MIPVKALDLHAFWSFEMASQPLQDSTSWPLGHFPERVMRSNSQKELFGSQSTCKPTEASFAGRYMC